MANKWYRISISNDQVIASTFKAGLIQLDDSAGKLKDFCFWFPKKLIRHNGGINKEYTFSLTLEFKITVFKLTKAGVKTSQREICAIDLLHAHGIEIETKETETEKEKKETQTELKFEAKKTA